MSIDSIFSRIARLNFSLNAEEVITFCKVYPSCVRFVRLPSHPFFLYDVLKGGAYPRGSGQGLGAASDGLAGRRHETGGTGNGNQQNETIAVVTSKEKDRCVCYCTADFLEREIRATLRSALLPVRVSDRLPCNPCC